ncbi:ankyrin repeat domain-containing protein [Tanticharoenia sakaeratensis]|uniref:Uncharacterized protein n=1 Tax=Tanticharoenia sakaeratensis NBRC 103193 TaxID=1231623 RepID=A0A0D6MJ35_9PROT|nr:ankyrin repeat domain-containing protein [Tanticharoenia sakaeratensis]GAN53647.1 hypothetical protein Tasa_010_194 [Tanticharoenia sakaeratensis NBRC 103193]GBQ17284.1 ankyrin repeat protein [Tanticharoenia sakaeratensis NBRC 103193]
MTRFLRLFLIACVIATPVAFVPWHAAHAQDADDAEAEQEAMDAQKKKEARRAAKMAAPPSALPGAESQEEESGHANTDLNPTSALFDAINRGSLGAAKEALNRGADMGGHNVLGQTPLDMAIDLNRNDITFLLLSMRTYNPDGKIETASDLSDEGVDTKGSAGHLTLNGHTRRSAPVPTGPHYETGGGTPQPDIGFLGFASR